MRGRLRTEWEHEAAELARQCADAVLAGTRWTFVMQNSPVEFEDWDYLFLTMQREFESRWSDDPSQVSTHEYELLAYKRDRLFIKLHIRLEGP